jgi:ADP-ribose pyrophosphatase
MNRQLRNAVSGRWLFRILAARCADGRLRERSAIRMAKKKKSAGRQAEKQEKKVDKKWGKKLAKHAVPVVKKLKIDHGRPAKVLSSQEVFEGPLFRVVRDEIEEPTGKKVKRDVIRHNGSAVILAIDDGKSRKDPLVLIERQFRHAAQHYLYEVPAGKMDDGEDHLEAAKRELREETGYSAKKWTKLVRYFASPGFLGEWMQVFLAEGLTAGEAAPEEDESFELQFVPLSELLKLIDAGKVLDGKTIISAMYYARWSRKGRKKK